MKKLIIFILFLVTSVSMMHLSGVFRFEHIFNHANAARAGQERADVEPLVGLAGAHGGLDLVAEQAGEGGAEFERVADSLRSLGLRCLPD